MRTTEQVLDWAEFVATKFESSRDGWTYTRDSGDLKHIRYGSDSTGYNHWWRRVRRAIDWKHLTGRDSFSRAFGSRQKRTLQDRVLSADAWVRVSLRKETHLPDGVVNGGNIITHWEEDGEYITLFGPTVGAKIINFLRAEPEHPHAQLIAAEMVRVAELSWPSDAADE